MSTSHVIHFGFDDCRRTPVMQAAGMQVDHCLNIADLQTALRSETPADLICISEAPNHPREDALVISRALSPAPILLFRNTSHHYLSGKFDLEIEPLTPPDIWLIQMDSLIQRSREIQRRSQVLVDASRRLRDECVVVREQSRALRQQIADRRSKPEPF